MYNIHCMKLNKKTNNYNLTPIDTSFNHQVSLRAKVTHISINNTITAYYIIKVNEIKKTSITFINLSQN